ncbi:MAG: purine-nucleoside phosphorylase [Gemmatimonadetes bacterium]|nr:purine-nucleoside phosphorylase [Gemmatimonadota bacterium]
MAWIRARTAFQPEVGVVLGSGWGPLSELVDAVLIAEYAVLPGFAPATAPGHLGRLVLGELEGRRVCVFDGRLHAYEGHSAGAVAAGMRLLDELGATACLLTNAAGIVNRRLRPGRLMLISDQLNLTCLSPLAGRRPHEVRDPFPDMSRPFDPQLLATLRTAALAEGLALEEGVYAGVLGPSYETPAEVEFLRRFGADAVGMSTVLEVIAARERSLGTAAVACLTNLASGLSPLPLREEDVLRAATGALPQLEALVRSFLRRLPA